MAIVDPFAAPTAPTGIVDPFAPPAAAQPSAAVPDMGGTMEGFAPPTQAAGFAPAGALPRQPALGAAPDTSMAQRAGVVTRALAPYAAAATTGALAGAPFGGVGAVPGALLGLGALGVSNLATGAYNLAAPMFGGAAVDTPSEAIRNALAAGGIGRKPVTSEQALAAAALEGGLDAASLAGAGRVIGGRIGNFFAQRPVVQTVGGVGAAATPTAMREYSGVENPYALAAGSLVGGISAAKFGARTADVVERATEAGKRLVTNANISSEALKQRAQDAFNATDASGVVYDASALSNFAQNIRQTLTREKYYPSSPRYNEVTEALKQVDLFAKGSRSIGDLHSLRQDLRKYAQDAGPDGGRMIDKIIDGLDDFVASPRNATFAAAQDVTEASNTLKSAISDWSKLSKSNQIETLIERASRNESTPFASSLRVQFKTLANNPQRMARFTKAEQEAIDAIAKGTTESTTLKLLSQLAPSFKLRDIARTSATALTGAAGFYSGSMPLMATAAGMSAVGLGTRAARNALAGQEANALAAAMRRGDVRAPVITPAIEMFQRGIPQAIMQAQQPADYYLPSQ